MLISSAFQDDDLTWQEFISIDLILLCLIIWPLWPLETLYILNCVTKCYIDDYKSSQGIWDPFFKGYWPQAEKWVFHFKFLLSDCQFNPWWRWCWRRHFYICKMDTTSFRHMPFCHMPICHSRFAICRFAIHKQVRHTMSESAYGEQAHMSPKE